MSVGSEYKVDKYQIFDIDENTENTFVTIDEILDVAPASKFIADSCFSGQLVLDIERKIGNHEGIFVLASSMDFIMSIDKENEGGLLFTALYNLTTAEDEKRCYLDLDKDGIISEREAFFGIMANGFKDNLSEFKKTLGENFKVIDEENSPNLLQFAFSNPSNKCFLPNNSKCEDLKSYPIFLRKILRFQRLQ